MPPRKTGRRPKISPELHKKLVETITAGNYLETSAAYAGIGISTLYSWLDKGRKARDLAALDERALTEDEKPYVELLEDIEKARATAEARAVVLINRAANEGTWQAAAWFLERTAPKRWGRRDHLTHSNPDGGPVEVNISSGELEDKVLNLLSQFGTPNATD